jgi:aldehyde:ferredoxin oxidoreductase
MNGYTGKILRIHLGTGEISILSTKKYQQWGGGHGIGSAIFWNLVKNKAITAFDPQNVITIMTSPLTGTLVPGASSRTEVQGIGPHSSPIEWFTRSNFGGRFGPMLKFAGWDGIVIEGRAKNPVWISIKNSDVSILNAVDLWGLNTWQTQEEIWRKVIGANQVKGWTILGNKKTSSRTTQMPAVLTIGPAGENLSRIACLIHDAAHASGQGGFGGVWGSKNLKAISVIGSGSISIAKPRELVQAYLWSQKNYGLDLDNPDPSWHSWYGPRTPQLVLWERNQPARLKACFGCHLGCREMNKSGLGNESVCVPTTFYRDADKQKHNGAQTDAAYIASDLLQQYGINAYEAFKGLYYIKDLNERGILGPDKPVHCNLDFSRFGEIDFVQNYLQMIAFREGIGDDFSEGFYRAAKRWGTQEEDLKTGLLEYPYWGLPEHGCDPRTQVEWGYGSILGDRDISEHDFSSLSLQISKMKQKGITPPFSAHKAVYIMTEKMEPFSGNMNLLNFCTDNIYSEDMARLVAWHRYYTRFWKQSILFCEMRWPDFINSKSSDLKGQTGIGETNFFNAVTGKDLTFKASINIGRKIWNLDNAIWSAQGRHRDMVCFADYIYTKPFEGNRTFPKYYATGQQNGKWDYVLLNGRHLDKDEFESFKTRYYKLEGWDIHTGWPLKSTLESLGLLDVADELSHYLVSKKKLFK